MLRWLWIVLATVGLANVAGCRCFPGFNCYANAIDDIGDTDVLFDQWYNPRLDISRAGRPDWCGPINCRLGGCVCFQGTWKRYDECWLYPPSYPYTYPAGNLYTARTVEPMSQEGIPTSEAIAPQQLEPERSGVVPPPAPPPGPQLPPSPEQGWRSRGTQVQ